MGTTEGSTLRRLSETDLTISDPQADVRGRKVVDAAGEDIGKVDDLLVDDAETRVRMLLVEHGGFLGIGADHFLVPVDAVTSVTDDEVRIDRERSRLTDTPGYDPAVARRPDYYGDVYGWWGFDPYWRAGYSYPPYPRGPY
jgi:sporulation protein YlmC with PRC-barrel domain